MIVSFVHQLYTSLFDLFFPPFCASCRAWLSCDEILCTKCIAQIKPFVSHTLAITKKRSIVVYAMSDYTYPIKKLILAKGSKNISVARQLGKLVCTFTPIGFVDYDLVVPIALHWRRYAQRGYNQAHEMAHECAKYKNVLLCDVLVRTRHTKRQSSCSADERVNNVKDAFVIKDKYKKVLKNTHVLLVDDLMTSGATLHASARALFAVGVKKVTVVVASRVT